MLAIASPQRVCDRITKHKVCVLLCLLVCVGRSSEAVMLSDSCKPSSAKTSLPPEEEQEPAVKLGCIKEDNKQNTKRQHCFRGTCGTTGWINQLLEVLINIQSALMGRLEGIRLHSGQVYEALFHYNYTIEQQLPTCGPPSGPRRHCMWAATFCKTWFVWKHLIITILFIWTAFPFSSLILLSNGHYSPRQWSVLLD